MDNYLLLPRALASAAYYGCFAAAVGVVLSRWWLSGSPVASRLRLPMLTSALGLVLLVPVQLWLMTAAMLGSSAWGTVRPVLWQVLTSTHAGRVLVPDLVLGVLLVSLAGTAPLWKARRTAWTALALCVVLAAFRAASGHASSDGDFTVREAVQFVHLSSIAVWAGGVMVAGWLVLPALRDDSRAAGEFGRKLSRVATVAVVLVVLSGAYNGWQGLGGADPSAGGVQWHALVGSQWGWLLTAKSALVWVALLLGGANRWLLRKGDVLGQPQARHFGLLLRCEGAVMAAVLLVTGFLANSPPATGQ